MTCHLHIRHELYTTEMQWASEQHLPADKVNFAYSEGDRRIILLNFLQSHQP